MNASYVLEYDEAKLRGENKIPFRPSKEVREPLLKKGRKKPVKVPDYAMLIIGCDTTNPDPNMHNCVIKNSYDKGFGQNGEFITGLDYFNYIIEPVYEYDVGSDMQEDSTTPLDKVTDANVLKECIFIEIALIC